jgi:hypothetical protein
MQESNRTLSAAAKSGGGCRGRSGCGLGFLREPSSLADWPYAVFASLSNAI